MKRLPFDEINALEQEIKAFFIDKNREIPSVNVFEDLVLDLLITAYVFGVDDVNEMLGEGETPDVTDMYRVINMPIAGETYRGRIAKYVREQNADDIARVIDTETHRVYNTAVNDTATKVQERTGKKLMKRWDTMMDDRVRDSHEVLQGVEIPMDEKFYTDGDEARFPGDFASPELNCNCRCGLTVFEA